MLSRRPKPSLTILSRACSTTSAARATEDLREIRRRIETLADERRRELDAVESRYDDIRAWEFPAAVIFAIAPQDLENGVVIR